MRNKRLLATLIAVAVLTILFLCIRKTADQNRNSVTTSIPQMPSKSTSVPGTEAEATSPPTLPPANSYESAINRVESDYRTPINFYGRVLDQHGLPVPAANVNISANDKWNGPSSEYFRTTDAQGLFSITGIHGLTLVVRVTKSAYREIPRPYGKVTSSGLFEYGLSSKGPYRSSKEQPTIFTLHKIGNLEPLVKIAERNFRMARDGIPLFISLDGKEGHQVVLRCWNKELERPEGQRVYDWRLEISVPTGGLLLRKDNFAFNAPQYGYMPSDSIEMSASLPQGEWRGSAERSYFFQFADGTYACAKLEMQAGGDHFVVWESYFNPKPDSTNLESD